MITIANKKTSLKNLEKKFPNAMIIDVTSKAEFPFVQFSPFYPHGNIPVPFSEGVYSLSVEGVWQGLKVFEKQDIDLSKFEIANMSGIKRTERKFGKPLGHRKGVLGKELLDYKTARREIYLKTYAYLLDNILQNLVNELIETARYSDIVLLDYETNIDIEDLKKPLSHAGLIKRYIEKRHPELKENEIISGLAEKSTKEVKARKKRTKKKTTNDMKMDNRQIDLFKSDNSGKQ